MHIAIVHRDLHQITRGGICTLYRTLATHLAARGHHLTLITQESPHPLAAETGVSIETLPRTDDLAQHRRSVAQRLHQLKPDIVECSTWEAEVLTYLAEPRELRAPVMVRGEFSAATLGAAELAADERRLVHHTEKLIAVSRWAAQDLTSAYGIATPAVVYNGIDRIRFQPGPPGPPTSGLRVTLTATGQLDNPALIPDLLRVQESIPPFSRDPHGRLHLVWVGKITKIKGWDILEKLVIRLRDIAAITVLLGHSQPRYPVGLCPEQLTVLHDLSDADVPNLYRSADWILSTSRWEGFGLAIAEAMACGTPALLPQHLGTAPELLSAGGGFTYRDADDLADILMSQQRPPGGLPDHFDWNVNAEETLTHYRQLTDAR
ncbi:glycosyltransferase family 4 protein [Nocardia goodfellowii]